MNDGKKNSTPDNWTDVWKAGVLIFGDKWILKNGEKPSGEWANVLLGFDEKQLSAGIKRMRKDAEVKIKSGDEAWPPIAFEFACLCKATSSLYFPSASKELPPPKANKEFAQEQLNEIRRKCDL